MWDTKYRPLKFSDVLGQQGAVGVLRSRLRNGTAMDTSYLFCGGPGQGKTTLARILARAILCLRPNLENPDPCNECDNCKAILNEDAGAFIEMDAASRGSVENVRKIVDDLPFAVFGAKKRIYLFDECHQMSRGAQDVLLKPIEEKRMIGMFCTTEPEKVRGAIRQRCEEHAIRKVTREDILARMKWVLEQEKVEYEEDGVLTVIDFSGGHVRDVLNRLEMIAQTGPITLDSVRNHLNLSVVSTYYHILLKLPTETKEALALVDRACERVTPEEVASGLAEASMNSFRMSNSMLADFAFSDKELGKKLYELYGPQTVKLAEFFLRARHASQVSLICDLVTLAQSLGAGTGVVVSAPVVKTVAFTPVVVQTSTATESLPVTHASTITPTTTTPITTAPQTPQVTVSKQPAAPKPTTGPASLVRDDGIGPLGSSDNEALTDFDHHVVPRKDSKVKKDRTPFLFPRTKGNDTMPPSSWKVEFERLWRARG